MNVPLLVLTAVLCQGSLAIKQTSCNCGWVNRGRIIGGVETRKNEYPWMAALYDEREKIVYCGASIITPRHALTAAHCNDGQGSVLLVGLHYSQKHETAQKVPIALIVDHDRYSDRPHFKNDIAVVYTRSEIVFNQNVGPVCLPTGRIQLEGETVKAIGWGLTETGKASPVLRSADLTVISYNSCRKSWSFLAEPQSQLCIQDEKKSPCKGDSGGPQVWLDPETNRYTLVSLTSFGKKGCLSTKPGVCTEVGAFIPWIEQTLKERGGGRVCKKI